MKKQQIVIVHFNTPDVTKAVVSSVRRFCPEADITIFDNSTTRPFPWKSRKVGYIDNTQGDFIDLDRLIRRYPKRVETTNDWGSVRHMASVDRCFDLFPDGFVLLDSDAMLRADIARFFDTRSAWVGEAVSAASSLLPLVPRVLPYLCWINVPMCTKAGIRYFDPKRSWALKPGSVLTWYDTGASFYEDCKAAGLPFRNINIGKYVCHLGGASFRRKPAEVAAWLDANARLWKEGA